MKRLAALWLGLVAACSDPSALAGDADLRDQAQAPDAAGADSPTPKRPSPPSAPPVLPGVDVALQRQAELFGQRRVGLLTHAGAVTRDGRRTVDALLDAGVDVVRLFTPEHGFGADREGPIQEGSMPGEGLDDGGTQLPVVSLYGDTRAPSQESLADLDLFVVDLQDVGVRFYTYAATLGLALEACARAELPVLVLDRPNPLGGELVAGPLLDLDRVDTYGLVCWHPLPVVHGCTLGELALLVRAERPLAVELDVVPVSGWSREMRFDQTGLRWVAPSPNLPDFEAARVYAGPALWEFTNLSVGRGTATPFRTVGAPWCDPSALLTELERDPPAGVIFAPTTFTPSRDPFQGQRCHGVRIEVVEPAAFDPVDLGLALGLALVAVHPERWDRTLFNKLLANREAASIIAAGGDRHALRSSWARDLAGFKARRAAYLLYP